MAVRKERYVMLIFISKKKWQALCEVVDRIDGQVEHLSAEIAAIKVSIRELDRAGHKHRREVKQRISELDKKLAAIDRMNKR